MPILDTSFLGRPPAGPKGGPGPPGFAGGGPLCLCTTPITAPELYLGAFLSANPERSLEAAKRLLDSLVVLPLDDEVCIVFGALAARLRSEGRRIGDFDEVIAAIALARDREIVTRDLHFPEVAWLVVVGW